MQCNYATSWYVVNICSLGLKIGILYLDLCILATQTKIQAHPTSSPTHLLQAQPTSNELCIIIMLSVLCSTRISRRLILSWLSRSEWSRASNSLPFLSGSTKIPCLSKQVRVIRVESSPTKLPSRDYAHFRYTTLGTQLQPHKVEPCMAS